MSVHIVSHTSLRGIAAMAVFWGHYSDVFARDVGGWNLFVPHTHLGVDLFFMLSGFVLYHVYASQFLTGVTGPRWGAFMRQRLLRIYPLHLVTLLAVLVLMRFELPGDGLWILGLNLTLTHAWGLTDQFIFNAPSWSISAEFAAYLVFPFMVLATGTRAGRWGLGALAAARRGSPAGAPGAAAGPGGGADWARVVAGAGACAAVVIGAEAGWACAA